MTAQRIDPDRIARAEAALDAEVERAARHDEHVWIVAAAFRISPDVAAGIARGEDPAPLLDAENLLSLAPGCYRCEEPLTARLLGRRCRGA